MPFTPFHFGPGAAFHSVAPKHVSFLSFAGINVLIDIEPLSYMLAQQYPVHRFLHTYVGATMIWLVVTAAFLWLSGPINAVLRWLRWRELTLLQVSLGAALGAYSHIVLDSIMHTDIRPFAPFSDANPLHGALGLSALHLLCLAAGILGLTIIAARFVARPPD